MNLTTKKAHKQVKGYGTSTLMKSFRESPELTDFVGSCSPLHVWNLWLLRRIDQEVYDVYSGYFAGRPAEDVDQLFGKEIRDMVDDLSVFTMPHEEVLRTCRNGDSDNKSVWWQPCEAYLAGRQCSQACRYMHVVDRR